MVASYNKYLQDFLGNGYERKNLYIKDYISLEEKISRGESQYREDLKNLKRNKSKHPYIIDLNKFKKEEKKFLQELKVKKKEYETKLDKNLYPKIKDYKAQLFISKEKKDFYQAYKDLTYDAKLSYGENKLKLERIPEIIEFLEDKDQELNQAYKRKDRIDKQAEEDIGREIKEAIGLEKRRLQEEKIKVKESYRNSTISKKAKNISLAQLKKHYKEEVKIISYRSKRKTNKEHIKNLKYELKTGLKTEENLLKADLSDIKAGIPIEKENKRPLISYLSLLLPGLGQALNKQYIKASLVFLLSLFIYLIALPYALGFGNYQGEGISGLISLAQDGRRVDKSIIFMIEGILAIFFLIASLIIFYISFRDVNRVEKNIIKGIRPNSWFETKTSIGEKGFPYLVSLPALIVTVFIVIVPITTTILLSFSGMDPSHQSKFGWLGLENYKLIALGRGIAGSAFWLILGWTILWTILATSLAIFIGFALAILANNERIKGKLIFRTIYLLPWAVPAFITIMFFSIMVSPNGILTELISNLAGRTIHVKTDGNLSRMALILLQGWLGSSYIFLLSTGVLQSIPNDLYEAADIDGATSWQRLRKITLPIVLFQTAPLLVGQYTFNFNNFSIIYLFNGGGPFNPTKYGNLAGSSDLLISYIYKLTMENQHQAIGAAITVLISIGLMFFAFLGFKNSKAFREERL